MFSGNTSATFCGAAHRLSIRCEDGYVLEGDSNMREISRDSLELMRQTLNEHQYPGGFAPFLGTLFEPVQDRDEPGTGFTHKIGDVVAIERPSSACWSTAR